VEVPEGGQRLTAGLVGGDDAVNEIDVGTTGLLAGAEGLGVLTKRTQVDHAPECSQDRAEGRTRVTFRTQPALDRTSETIEKEPGDGQGHRPVAQPTLRENGPGSTSDRP